MPDTHYNLVDGEWIESETGDTFESHNPASPNTVVGVFQQSDEADTERAIDAARDAAARWADTPAPERGAILRRTSEHLDDQREALVELLVREEGKVRSEAAGEVDRAIDIFAYYGQKAREIGGDVRPASDRNTRLLTVREPFGVAGLITPWNYPAAIPAWKLGPALAAGNTVVLKPASLAPGVAHLIVESLVEAGVPNGVVNFVTGPGSSVGSVIASHEGVDAVSFTGSAKVGQAVREQAAADGKRVQLEMGGKNPTLVTDNADLATATQVVADGAFGVTGQACTACSRALVHESIYDEFLERIVDAAASIKVGPGLEGGEMGPHVSEAELESTLNYIEVGRNEGATLETGGSQIATDGYFVEPTVFSDVDPGMRIAQEEIFGPVLAVVPVADFEEGIAVANGTRYGLSASIVTDSHTEAQQFVDEVEAGLVKVNERTSGVELHVPFGGTKASSSETYREQGEAGIDFFTITKTAYMNY